MGAHPDDCEFGAGGTVYEWTRAGARVYFVVVTDGSQGSAGCQQRPQDLVAMRREEQARSALVLGVKDCLFLGFRDGEVSNDDVLLRELVKVLREVRPQVVFTHTPEHLDHRPFRGSNAINHRDHRAVGATTLDAVYPYARNPNSFQGLKLDPHVVRQVYLWGSRFPNARLSCAKGIRKKAEALACHRSQFAEDTDWDSLVAAWGTEEEFERIDLA